MRCSIHTQAALRHHGDSTGPTPEVPESSSPTLLWGLLLVCGPTLRRVQSTVRGSRSIEFCSFAAIGAHSIAQEINLREGKPPPQVTQEVMSESQEWSLGSSAQKLGRVQV